MREFVGVKSNLDILASHFQNKEVLKREALMFSRVAIPDLKNILYPGEIHLTEENVAFLAHMEWLLENGVIYSPQELPSDSQIIANSDYVESVKQKADLDHNLKGLFNRGIE